MSWMKDQPTSQQTRPRLGIVCLPPHPAHPAGNKYTDSCRRALVQEGGGLCALRFTKIKNTEGHVRCTSLIFVRSASQMVSLFPDCPPSVSASDCFSPSPLNWPFASSPEHQCCTATLTLSVKEDRDLDTLLIYNDITVWICWLRQQHQR